MVESRERMEELLALWRGLDQVDVLALPGLDTVCVEWQESESLSRAALFFAGRLDCHNQFLRELFAPGIRKAAPWGQGALESPAGRGDRARGLHL